MSEKYIVEYGLDGTVSGCNTIQDLERYLATDPHPLYRLVSCNWNEGNYTLIWETVNEGRTALLEACKKTYRKHFLDDPAIGWEKLTDEVHDALIDAMGLEAFNDWMDSLSEKKGKA